MTKTQFRIFQLLGFNTAEFRDVDTGRLLSPVDIAMRKISVPGGRMMSHPRERGAGAMSLPMSQDEATRHFTGLGLEADPEQPAAPVLGRKPAQPAVAASHDARLEPGERITSVKPLGGGMVMIGIERQPVAYEPDTLTLADHPVRFRVGSRTTHPDGTPLCEVALEVCVDGEWEAPEDCEITDLPASLAKAGAEGIEFPLRAEGDIASIRAELTGLGFTETDELFLWHTPAELDFCVQDDDGDLSIFVLPRDSNSPCFDNLRDDHLSVVPKCFGGNLMENTWDIAPGFDEASVIVEMTGLGFILNKDLV